MAVLLDSDLTRRGLLAGLGGAALLAGCGTTPVAPAPPATRTFVDDTGAAVEVPDVPRRIYALRANEAAGLVLALGAPVAAIAGEPGEVDAIRAAGLDPGDAVVLPRYEIDVERVAAVGPDLILGLTGDEELYGPDVFGPLRAVAPVVAIETEQTPVEAVTDRVAELLGAAATIAPATLRAGFDQALATLRDAPGVAWSEVSVAHLYALDDGTFNCYSPTSTPVNDLLSRLGVTWNALVLRAADAGGYITDQSPETVGTLAADLLVHDGPTDRAGDPLFAALPQVVTGQVLRYPDPPYGKHLPNYTVVARELAARVGALAPLRTDLV